jgi:hypothetical protein
MSFDIGIFLSQNQRTLARIWNNPHQTHSKSKDQRTKKTEKSQNWLGLGFFILPFHEDI